MKSPQDFLSNQANRAETPDTPLTNWASAPSYEDMRDMPYDEWRSAIRKRERAAQNLFEPGAGNYDFERKE